jgi:hypothetical protein
MYMDRIMFKFLLPVVALLLFCIPASGTDFAPGQLYNDTQINILTWSNGGYTVCPPGESVGHFHNGVLDCDWYYNPYTGMWVKITATETWIVTFAPTVHLTEEDENYSGPGYSIVNIFIDPVEPSLMLPSGPGTPPQWSEVPYQYLPLLIPTSSGGSTPEDFDPNIGISQ